MHLTRAHWNAMREQILSALPEESCGLLGGMGEQVCLVVPVTNELHSPIRFRMDPQEQLNAFLRFEAAGIELIGIYHSHPRGPAVPSPTDVAEFAYPDVKSLIWSPQESHWTARAFIISTSMVHETPLLVMPDV
jgi:proteasome lid subunit RPN8/RPN11